MKLKELLRNKLIRYTIIGLGACLLLGGAIWYGYDKQNANETIMQKDTERVSKYEEWKVKNPDFYAWLKIDGTGIDFPVMYRDNDYYLNHNAEQEEDIYGVPFVDSRGNIEERDTNLLIHGHSTLSGPEGKMFDDLLSYRDEAYYQDHKIIQFDTIEEMAQYEIVMVIESRVMYKNENNYRYYNFLNVETKEEWDMNIESLKQLQLYETEVEVRYGDSLITLSTCDYTKENGRFAIIARKI